MYVYIYIYTYTYIHIYICIYVYHGCLPVLFHLQQHIDSSCLSAPFSIQTPPRSKQLQERLRACDWVCTRRSEGDEGGMCSCKYKTENKLQHNNPTHVNLSMHIRMHARTCSLAADTHTIRVNVYACTCVCASAPALSPQHTPDFQRCLHAAPFAQPSQQRPAHRSSSAWQARAAAQQAPLLSVSWLIE